MGDLKDPWVHILINSYTDLLYFNCYLSYFMNS